MNGADLLKQIDQASDESALETLRVKLLGKKGELTEQLKSLGQKSADERKILGAELNQLKTQLEAAFDARKALLQKQAMQAALASQKVDVTLPARAAWSGSIHPITRVMQEAVAIFADLGFAVAEGPDIEDDAHNFAALNFPLDHPARQMQATFFTGDQSPQNPVLLRTHTSPVQIRTMQAGKPPFRIVAPGRVYRFDYDQTHTPMFHQLEGLLIDEAIHMGHLKWVQEQFLKTFFNLPECPLRFRPSFFPFTEPSAEVDMRCDKSRKDKLVLGSGADWMEIGGCGMVHPQVLRNCGIDPDKYQGWAFGFGLDRLAMLKYGIPDLRTFFEADLRWLRHYGFSAHNVPQLLAGLTS